MGTNSIIANMNALSLDEEQKKQREKYKADMQADIDADGASWDSQISTTQKYYDKQIGDAKIAYDSEYQKNAVQKLINEKQIAEKNANLGLTDSGLNRTQQTAAQLSYANQKGKIDLARQSALDNLTLAMTDAITTLQNQKATSARNITNKWNNYADTQAQNIYDTKYNGYVDMYNAQVKADADVQKAAIEANNSKGASFTEFNKINEEISSIFEEGNVTSIPWVSKKARKKAAEKIYTYYASGFINDAQKQALINEYGLKDYFNSNNGIPIYTYEETPAARSFVAKIRTPHEFARGENSDKSTYKTYKDYVKGMLEKYESELTDNDIATISQMYGLE